MAALRKPGPWPRGEDLPDSDGVPMESEFHPHLTRIYLIEPLRRWLKAKGLTAFVGGNSFVYYDPEKPRQPAGPDVYVVNGGVYRRQKKWVVWEEEWRFPTLIIEFVSESTEHLDRGPKKRLYQNVFHCPDYFIFNDETLQLDGFHMRNNRYVRVRPYADATLQCSTLDLRLGVLDGKLRWIQPDGELVKTGIELADAADRRAEASDRQAEEAKRRAEAAARAVEQMERRFREAEQHAQRLQEELQRLKPKERS